MTTLERDGFEIHREVFSLDEIAPLREHVYVLAKNERSVCLRNLSQKSPLILNLSTTPKLTNLLPPGVSPVRSLLFDKTPESNWPVAWHQDLTIPVRKKIDIESYGPWSIKDEVTCVQPPIELLEGMATIRIHLDPTSPDNGALRVVSGSHRMGKLSAETIRQVTADSSIHTCDCRPGDVLVMSPLLLHSSVRSTTPSQRRIVHIEYARLSDLDTRLSWQPS